jgi:hypothetical protein
MAKKIAMCVGQNYYAPQTLVTPLRGCVNDALLIGEMLRMAGFQEVRQIHNEPATQEGILRRLAVEIAKLREGDYFVFWNSSHGYQLQDRNYDELVDGLDEAICTYDTDPRDPLTDDKFAKILVRAHPKAFVFLGSDSCHSGSLTRGALEGMENNDRTPRLWLPPDDILFRTGRPTIDLGAYIEGFKDRKVTQPPLRRFGFLARSEEDMQHLLLSGCKAEEVSWDAKFPQGHHGAMTYNFVNAVLKAWHNGKAITYREAHQATLDGLEKDRFDQNPQLEGPDRLKDTPVFGFVPR